MNRHPNSNLFHELCVVAIAFVVTQRPVEADETSPALAQSADTLSISGGPGTNGLKAGLPVRPAEIQDLPATFGRFEVSESVRREVNQFHTTSEQIGYLSSILSSNAVVESGDENFRKASALRLLGEIKSTNSINVLVTNLAFLDQRYRYKPAVRALVAIGEPSVPGLLTVLEDSTSSPERCQSAVEALMGIKGADPDVVSWIRFVLDEQKRLSPDAWDRLKKYGSTF